METMTAAGVEVFVPGHPQPQGSKRHVGRGRMVESANGLPAWRDRVGYATHNAMVGRPLIGGPLTVALEFVLRRPLSAPKRRTPPAVRRPDLDKLVRAVLDALTGVAIHDDSQVIRLVADKRLAEIGETPGVTIRIHSETTPAPLLAGK